LTERPPIDNAFSRFDFRKPLGLGRDSSIFVRVVNESRSKSACTSSTRDRRNARNLSPRGDHPEHVDRENAYWLKDMQ
jgi:hypothetical protein